MQISALLWSESNKHAASTYLPTVCHLTVALITLQSKCNTVYSVANQPYRYSPNSHSRRQHVIQHVRHKGFIPSLPKRNFPFATHMVFGSFFQDLFIGQVTLALSQINRAEHSFSVKVCFRMSCTLELKMNPWNVQIRDGENGGNNLPLCLLAGVWNAFCTELLSGRFLVEKERPEVCFNIANETQMQNHWP